jgi:hypothetical protein
MPYRVLSSSDVAMLSEAPAGQDEKEALAEGLNRLEGDGWTLEHVLARAGEGSELFILHSAGHDRRMSNMR